MTLSRFFSYFLIALIPGGTFVLFTEYLQKDDGYPRGLPWFMAFIAGLISTSLSYLIIATMTSLPFLSAYIIAALPGSFLLNPFFFLFLLKLLFTLVHFLKKSNP